MQASRLTAIATWLRSGGGTSIGVALGEAAGLDLLALDDLPELGIRIVRDAPASGWSVISSSATMRRAVLARSVWVFTFMPGVGVRMQLAASTRSPSISTMQTRQLPSGR